MKWGIMATGTIAKNFANTVNQMKDKNETLVAVGSRNLESAKAFAEEYKVLKAYSSYDELVKDEEVEAIYISTPNQMHYENARMCLLAGKHVLCEKPFTTNVDEAERLFELAEEKGLFIMEAFWIRFLPLLQEMKRTINLGLIGNVVHVRSDFGFIATGARKDRKFDSSLGGGALLDIGIYNLGFAHMIMEEYPSKFTSTVHINEYGTDDFSCINLEYSGNRSASVTTAIGMLMPREAVIFGSKGSIYLPDYQKAEKMIIRPYEGEEAEVLMPFEVNGYEYEIKEVSRCVEAGLSTSNIFRKEDSLAILKLMDEIRQTWGMKFSFEN